MGNKDIRTLETIERAIDVITVLRDMDGGRVMEVANQLDMAPSTAHGYLSTLEQNRLLIKEGDEYNVGLRFLSIGGYASIRRQGYQFAKKKVKELAEETEERAQFIVEEHGRGIYLHTETSGSAVQVDARIGKETNLHASAAGKSILAHLQDDRKDEVIKRWGLPKLTENTITDRETLDKRLELVRNRNYSFNRNESIEGLRAVGVPVEAPHGDILGALSVSGPTNRMQGDWFEEEIPQLLLGAANEMELNIEFSN